MSFSEVQLILHRCDTDIRVLTLGSLEMATAITIPKLMDRCSHARSRQIMKIRG